MFTAKSQFFKLLQIATIVPWRIGKLGTVKQLLSTTWILHIP